MNPSRDTSKDIQPSFVNAADTYKISFKMQKNFPDLSVWVESESLKPQFNRVRTGCTHHGEPPKISLELMCAMQ